MVDVELLRSELPALRGVLYMNTGTQGPTPRAAQAAAARTHEEIESMGGPAAPEAMKFAHRIFEQARSALADLIGCDASQLALTQNTTDGVNLAVLGLDWREGDEVVAADLEHPGGFGPCLQLARRRGVKLVTVEGEDGAALASAYERAITPKTRLVCLSHVAFTSGARLPVEEVAEIARSRGALTLVDGAQGAGHLPVDVKAMGVDFYAFPGHKWLMGLGGAGGLYVSEEAMNQCVPAAVGYYSFTAEGLADGTYAFQPDARRFEVSTRDPGVWAALSASLDLRRRAGNEASLHRRIVELADRLREGLAGIGGLQLVGGEAARGGLVAFAVEGWEGAAAEPRLEGMVRWLWRERRVVCRTVPEPKGIRLSVHAFHTEEEIDRLVQAVDEAVRAAR